MGEGEAAGAVGVGGLEAKDGVASSSGVAEVQAASRKTAAKASSAARIPQSALLVRDGADQILICPHNPWFGVEAITRPVLFSYPECPFCCPLSGLIQVLPGSPRSYSHYRRADDEVSTGILWPCGICVGGRQRRVRRSR